MLCVVCVVSCVSYVREQHKREDLREVPIRFSSAEDYIRIFRPLLVEEFRASLEQDKEEDGTSPLLLLSIAAANDV